MIKYQTLDHSRIAGLDQRKLSHPPRQQFGFHYHDVEEWLEVRKGKITFFPAGSLASESISPYSLEQGEVLNIPRGEIHRGEVGSDGVIYRTWTPSHTGPFQKMLDEDELLLIRRNLQIPDVENRWEARDPDVLTAEDSEIKAFLDEFFSEDLVFRTASGNLLVGKIAYMTRPPPPIIPKPSASIRLVHLHSVPESIVLFTTVDTQSKRGGDPRSFANSRLFLKENRQWKCRLCINNPE